MASSLHTFSLVRLCARRENERRCHLSLMPLPRKPRHTPFRHRTVNYVSKPTEYLDTYFMAIKGNLRQITFLHVVHHALMPLIMYILITMVRDHRERLARLRASGVRTADFKITAACSTVPPALPLIFFCSILAATRACGVLQGRSCSNSCALTL